MTRTGSSPSPARTVFFGSGEFAVPILDAVASMPALAIVGVVTAPDRPKGRSGTPTPTAVAVRAAAARPADPAAGTGPRHPRPTEAIARLEPDLGVLADYGRIVPAGDPRAASARHPERPSVAACRGTAARRRSRRRSSPATCRRASRSSGWTTASTPGRSSPRRPGASMAASVLRISRRPRPAMAPTCWRGRSRRGWRARSLPCHRTKRARRSTRPFRREDGRLDPARPAVELERQVRANAPWPGTFIETADGRLAIIGASIGPPDASTGHDHRRRAG